MITAWRPESSQQPVKAEAGRVETPPPQGRANTPPALPGVGRAHPASQAQRRGESPREPGRKPELAAPEARCAPRAPNRAGRTPGASHFPHQRRSPPPRTVPSVAPRLRRDGAGPRATAHPDVQQGAVWGARPPCPSGPAAARPPRAPSWGCAHKSARRCARRSHRCVFLSGSRRPHRRYLCS